ncbi:MAG: sugar transferase [Anaerolineales bacterium]|nr:sugar transferase [Anaerolineales bacterium]
MTATDVSSSSAETRLSARRPTAAARRARSLTYSLLLDALLVNVAFMLGYYVRYELQLFRPVLDANAAPYRDYMPFQAGYALLLMVFLAMDGLYSGRREGSWFDELYRIGNATTTVVVILIAATFIILPIVYSRLLLLEAGLFTIALLSGYRLLRRTIEANLRRRGVGVERALIVGAGELGRMVVRNLVARPELGYRVVGFVDDDLSKGDLGRFKALGGLESISGVLKSERVDEVIITLPWMYHRTIMGIVRTCESLGVVARVVPDVFQLSLSRVDLDDLGGIPVMGLKETRLPRAARLLKRALDVVLAVAGLVALAPFWLVAALAIRLDSPGPALFRQRRVGEGGRFFEIYKFRSMLVGAEEQQADLKTQNEASGPLFKIKADPRLTRLGRLLRRSSLDELPQLINVLRGEMSLVGPRPGLPSEVAEYEAWHRQRLEVPPGITGLWQVSGRSDVTFDEMCLLDIFYIENWSLALDLVIMLRTIPHVLFADGAY